MNMTFIFSIFISHGARSGVKTGRARVLRVPAQGAALSGRVGCGNDPGASLVLRMMTLRKCFLSRLAAASLALGAGTTSVASAASPTLSADILAEWVEVELEADPESTPLSAVNCADRAATRARVLIGNLWPSAKASGEGLVRELAREPSATSRIAAAAALGRILELSTPAERIEIVCRWTVADDPGERMAIARALSLPTPVFVADLAILELSRDPSAEVRAAAVGAIRGHFRVDPLNFARVATELASDADPSVRRAAQNLVTDAMG